MAKGAEVTRRGAMAKHSTIQAVAERADFGPAYAGEDFVTLTFRVPKYTGAIPGIWELTPIRPGTLDWAKSKTDYDPDA